MYVRDDLGLGEREQIVIAPEIAWGIAQALAAKRGFVETPPLNHRAHRAIHDHDAFAEQAPEGSATRALRDKGVRSIFPAGATHGTPRADSTGKIDLTPLAWIPRAWQIAKVSSARLSV